MIMGETYLNLQRVVTDIASFTFLWGWTVKAKGSSHHLSLQKNKLWFFFLFVLCNRILTQRKAAKGAKAFPIKQRHLPKFKVFKRKTRSQNANLSNIFPRCLVPPFAFWQKTQNAKTFSLVLFSFSALDPCNICLHWVELLESYPWARPLPSIWCQVSESVLWH